MITRKNKELVIKNFFHNDLECDVCQSRDVAETSEGYVCRSCGIVLEIEKLEYHKPYNENAIQYAALRDNTDIGNFTERYRNPNSIELNRLQKQQRYVDTKKQVIQQAKIEIARIFSVNNYPEQLKEKTFMIFKDFRKKLKERSKYRSVDKLVPISIYFCFKLENVAIDESKLLEVSKITKKEFNSFKLQVAHILPEYKTRKREVYILQKVYELMEYFNLEMKFYLQAKKILEKLWCGIKNTTDLTIAGLVSSISILCSDQQNVPISAICKHLGIRMSTIQSQVKRRIFDQFKVNNFISLIKSSSVLKRIMIRLRIIEEVNSEIRLGNAVQVFNYFNDQNYFVYVLKNIEGKYSILIEKNKEVESPNKRSNCYLGNSYDLSVATFFSTGTGPPVYDPG